jgi:hypothetical protein
MAREAIISTGHRMGNIVCLCAAVLVAKRTVLIKTSGMIPG